MRVFKYKRNLSFSFSFSFFKLKTKPEMENTATEYKRPSFYSRFLYASRLITRRTERLEDGPPSLSHIMDIDQKTLYEENNESKWTCLDQEEDEEDYMNNLLEPYTSTLEKLSGTAKNINQNTRSTAVLIVLSPCALAAGNIARRRRRTHKPACVQF